MVQYLVSALWELCKNYNTEHVTALAGVVSATSQPDTGRLVISYHFPFLPRVTTLVT